MNLTDWTTCGGCAAKWGGAPLRELVARVARADDPDLLVGLSVRDDAAVYRLTDDLALVATTDFFPPLVDDPADYGAVAAANACSDVFAMGGRVLVALNVAAFPEDFPVAVIEEILEAAAAVVQEAGGTVAGGHTIRSAEPVFGLAVQGVVHPGRIWSKGGARPGDRLLLSKPLGTGIVLAGGDPEARQAAVAGMRTLNRGAAERLAALPAGSVRAATDVTGFGLAGHAWEMAESGSVRVVLGGGALPLYPTARELAARGVRTGGEDRNRRYLGEHLAVAADGATEALVLDPQTSGGLLAAVDPAVVAELLADGWWEIGEVAGGAAGVEVA